MSWEIMNPLKIYICVFESRNGLQELSSFLMTPNGWVWFCHGSAGRDF